VASGALDIAAMKPSAFVSTTFHEEFLADMMQSHLVKDFCIIGPRVRVIFFCVSCDDRYNWPSVNCHIFLFV